MAATFGTVVNAFGLAELAFTATSLLKQAWLSGCPSASRVESMNKILDNWQRWIDDLRPQERIEFNRMHGSDKLRHMQEVITTQRRALTDLAIEIRSASFLTRNTFDTPLRPNPLAAEFEVVQTVVNDMDHDFRVTTSRFRQSQYSQCTAVLTPLPLSPVQGRSHAELLPMVNPAYVRGPTRGVTDSRAAVDIRRQWVALRGRVALQNLSRGLRTAVDMSNDILASLLEYQLTR